jgi:hypothetical protein
MKTKCVYVSAYQRIRWGQKEHVRQHYRSLPN